MILLKEWASGFCAAGIACALLSALCPKGTVRQAFGVLTALLMLCGLLSPIGTLVSSLKDGLVVSSESIDVPCEVSEASMEHAIALIEEALYRDASKRLENTDMTLKRLAVFRDTDDENRIYIEKVRLVFDGEDCPVDSTAVQQLSMAWGIETEVYYD